MKWIPEVTSLGPDPEITQGLLKDAGYQFVPDDEGFPPGPQWHLYAEQWETLDLADVKMAATELAACLRSIPVDQVGSEKPVIEFGEVLRPRDDGNGYERVTTTISLGFTARVESLLTIAPVGGPTGSPEEGATQRAEVRQTRLRTIQRAGPYLRAALRDKDVRDVYRRLDSPMTLLRLRQIYELIVDNIGGDYHALPQLVPLAERSRFQKDMTRFWDSIHDPRVFPDNALHALPNYRKKPKPPAHPMYESEACDFVRQLVEQWVKAKA
jgi:hypothetical protein